jgi:hypothetical protein
MRRNLIYVLLILGLLTRVTGCIIRDDGRGGHDDHGHFDDHPDDHGPR